MNNRVLELEKSLFKYVFMSDKDYLNKVIDDNYIEVGKSGRKFNKTDVIISLSNLTEDRKTTIYNFECEELEKNIYLVHYITKNGNDNIYRTSIWRMKNSETKILFHQASLYKEVISLIEF